MKIFKNLYKSQERWIRPLLLLLQKQTHPPKIWTNPRKPVVLSSLWRWSMAQIFRLDSYSSRLKDDSGQLRSSAEDPSQVASTKPKQAAHSSRYHVVDPSSASDHYSDYSIDPQRAPSRPKKHSDKSKHKSRSRFLTPSSEEDQSPEHRHRSPKPSRKSYSDQDHPQHDPDPPYYREVALSDIPSQYAEEVDTTHPETTRS